VGKRRHVGDIPAIEAASGFVFKLMNRAFYIIGVPAFLVSFCWFWFGWGLRLAATISGIELGVVIAAIIYFQRRESRKPGNPGT